MKHGMAHGILQDRPMDLVNYVITLHISLNYYSHLELQVIYQQQQRCLFTCSPEVNQ